jgi:cobalt-zinc-cadmium efflux system membrane fusion protein
LTRASVLLAALLGAACQKEKALEPEAPKGASLFEVPKDQQAKLTVVSVEKRAIARPLHVPAVVAFNELKTSDVVPLVSGRVTKLLVNEGDHVTAGQPLLSIASPDSSDNTANLKRDRATLANKQTVLRRDQDLYEHKAISLEELQSAQLDVTSAQATLEDDEAHVKIAGTGAASASLRSPISGIIAARHVSVGEAVQSGGNSVFTVTDPTLIWVVAHVYPEDVRRVAVGDSAEIHSAATIGPMSGKVTYIGAVIDTDTLTVPIRIAVPNANGILKAGLYVDASITPVKTEDAELLPLSALLRDSDNLPFVYLEMGQGKFGRRHITIGDQVGDQIMIQDGLKAGERVLASGALFIQFADGLEH